MVLEYLGDCSFLPVFINKMRNLYPLKFGKHVLKLLQNVDNPEQKSLEDLNIPLLDEMCLDLGKRCSLMEKRCILEILKCLLASVESVIDTLNCLYFNRTALNCQMTACETMLKFFDRNLEILRKDSNCRMKLRHLPFYSGLDKNFISLNEREMILLPKEIPTEGLKEFGLRCGLTFIRPKDVSRDFWEYLGCVTTTSTELYIKHVLPKFNYLPNSTILQHLKFIKDIMISRLNYDNDKENLLSLDYLLRDIAFIPAGENRLARACDFFNPHKEIFKIENQLCKESEVPPSPFDGEEWEEFLIHCGMKSDMTPEIFIDFAKRVEKLGDVCGLTSLVRDNSYRMVDILLSDAKSTITTNCMHIIQKIRFLYPHQVRQVLQMLVPQFEGGNRLVCFQDSTMPPNDLLVWTVMGIISKEIEYKIRAKTDNMIAIGTLEPPLQNVLNHINILCHALSGSMSEMCAKNTDIEAEVTRVMAKAYEFLSKKGNDVSVRFLSDVPFIFIKDRRLFVLPQQIVLEMDTHEEIPPYLFKMPVCFGQFYSVFKMHGAAETLTCGHLAKVLFKIWKKSKGKILEPNEISSTKTAVKTLFSKLRREDGGDLNDFDLYLPSKSQRLIKSSALVFIDDKRLEERIKVNLSDMEYFVGFTELSMIVKDHVSEINRLPARHVPQFLSKVVKEQIEKECERLVVSSEFARTLQKFLHSIELVAGICRLVRDEQFENDDRCGEGKEIEIQKKLQSVRVRCVEQIKTLLFFEGKPLPNTTESKAVFSAEELDEIDSPILCIYVSETTVSRDSFYKENCNIISKHLNAFLGKPIKENMMHLPDILACIDEPKSIESKLDRGEIRRLESLDQLLASQFMPELGSEIPLNLHHLLDNWCIYLEDEEYVAYEVYDPIVDEDEACETKPVYILAKILKANASKEDNPSSDEWNITYLIDTGLENPIEAPATTVYRFLRNYSLDTVETAVVFSWKTDRLKKYLRDVLRTAFEKSVQEFKRTLKRSIDKCHLNYYINNKDRYNELYSFIIFIQSRLEDGKSVDDDEIFTTEIPEIKPPSNFEQMVIKRCNVNIHESNTYNKPTEGHYFSQFLHRGSQPGQARRWLRQAEYDFQSATLDKPSSTACNWACYKCHQVYNNYMPNYIRNINNKQTSNSL